ncbi:Helix-turn-helix domain (DUF4817) [Popillia japonica]|uniref:Helix-turn-helix domain (DUF4817) n=1 Tax=Popillia japonica TaxID=7064 RepID=A0AAW1N7Q0_POPJA
MENYSLQQRICVKLYYCGQSYRQIHDALACMDEIQQIPSVTMLQRLVEKFKSTGSVRVSSHEDLRADNAQRHNLEAKQTPPGFQNLRLTKLKKKTEVSVIHEEELAPGDTMNRAEFCDDGKSE